METKKLDQILIIQTAFIGDVILATALIEKLNRFYPNAQIDFVLRKGNETLLENHPGLREVMAWDKKNGKIKNLYQVLKKIRSKRYDLVLNLQRFLSSGMLSAFSGAKEIRGFKKNPLSFLFTKSFDHQITTDLNSPHEISRNQNLIKDITDSNAVLPKLYPQPKPSIGNAPYVTMSPASVWFTKMLPKKKWIELIDRLSPKTKVFLLGGPRDADLCQEIRTACTQSGQIEIMAGKLSLLESAALMKSAVMNYVNDSAPLHLASAMDAPVTAFFCSTVPEFGFGPLSSERYIKETKHDLSCRPCGITGKSSCPEGHFKCAEIEI